MSLRDGTKKMSKSDPSDYSRIMLNDGTDVIVQKIKKAKTDPLPLPSTLEEAKKRPEALNLLTIYAALSESNVQKIIANYAGKEFSLFKKDLSDLASNKLSPIATEMKKLIADTQYLDSIIESGKDKAIIVAEPVLSKVYEIVGFSGYNIPKK